MRQVEKWVEVKAPAGRVFALFSGLSNFPRWMSGVRAVEELAPRRTLWRAETASGAVVEWEAVTTVLDPERRFVWRAVRGPVAVEGDAAFEETRRGTTLVRLLLGYGGMAGGEGFELSDAQLEADLHQFKQFAESEAVEDGDLLTLQVPRRPPAGARNAAESLPPAYASPPPAALPRTEPPRPEASWGRPPRSEQAPSPTPPTRRAARHTPGARPAGRHKPLVGYWLLGVLLALALGTVWFFLDRKASSGEGDRAATPTAVASPPGGTVATPTNRAPAPNSSASVPNPAASAQDSRASADDPNATSAGRQAPRVTGAAKPDAARDPLPPGDMPPGAGADASRAAVRKTLSDWIAATNAGDITRLMKFYSPVLDRYYLRTGVPQAAVRSDKLRLYAANDAFRVTADEPQIIFEQGARVAHVRFRKRYEMEKGGRVRGGEVLQELSLVKNGGRWEISSERDLRVVR